MQEYRRKCCNCKKTWMSSVEREEFLLRQARLLSAAGFFGSLGGLFGGGDNGSSQDIRNSQAMLSELTNMQRCPSCGSSTFTYEIIDPSHVSRRQNIKNNNENKEETIEEQNLFDIEAENVLNKNDEDLSNIIICGICKSGIKVPKDTNKNLEYVCPYCNADIKV